MKTTSMTGLRTTAVAGGVALLMLVAACGGSAEEPASPDRENVEWAEGSDPIVAGGQDDGEGDAAEDDDKAGASGPEQSDDTDGAQDTDGADDATEADQADGSAQTATDVVAPAEDFDPCAGLPAEQVAGLVGVEVQVRESTTTPFGTACGYDASDSSAAVDLLWYSGDSSAEELLGANTADWSVDEKVRELTIPGAAAVLGIVGQHQEHDAQGALLVAEVDGGAVLASIAGDGATIEDVTALIEAVLAAA